MTAEVIPPVAPIMRLEGGMHTNMIRGIASNSSGNFLATVSLDKTIRLWSGANGELLQVLRIPINQGRDGKLFAVAVSPNGETIAVGGLTGLDWDNYISVYFFNKSSGAMIGRIPNLPSVINHLAFSMDGRFLAIVLSKKQGLRIYNVQNGQLVGQDKEYAADSFWVDFDSYGRVVTACDDGYVRLYDPKFQLITKQKLVETKRPYSVAFSPNGDKIIVGFRGPPLVTVVDGQNLSILYQPDLTDARGSLRVVAWSKDGKSIYASGDLRNNNWHLMRWWSNEGKLNEQQKSEYIDLPISTNTVMQLLPLLDGGIAYVATDPAVGKLDSQGYRLFHKTSPTVSFKDIAPFLKISSDGSVVQFSYAAKGQQPAFFDVNSMTLLKGSPGSEKLLAPITERPNFVITGWNSKTEPMQLNGKTIKLNKNEVPYSLAIDPQGRFFVLGTNFFLRLLTLQGEEHWRIPIPGSVFGINITENGRFIVAALSNGTIRWYLSGMGREVLAFFPHNDQRNWVLWNQNRLFSASPGAEEMLGWHFNQGNAKEAKFIPAAQFGVKYNRPDILRRTFK
ncbi:MAG: hypothetical protein H7832_01760 [Magnetococcus sp. DMHC-6]